MAFKICWLRWVKRLFPSEEKDKKPKKWRWSFRSFKFKQHPSLTAPNKTLVEIAAEQRKHALTVAVATAAAAEAAVAAAHAAAEVVRLTGASRSYHYMSKGDRNLAAIKIQSAYRGYLARKALRALKGLVRLQAIFRGRAVRRQLGSSLKHLPPVSRVQASKYNGTCQCRRRKDFPKSKKELEERELKPDYSCQRNWDYSMQSREEIEATSLKRQEAAIKRERMRKYSFSHRERRNSQVLEESFVSKEVGRGSGRLDQWMDKQTSDKEGIEISRAHISSNWNAGDICGTRHIRVKNPSRKNTLDELVSRPELSFPRRSFCHVNQNSIGNDTSMPNSPVFPTYMAVTESARAKVRSMSTPRQRVGLLDIYPSHKDGTSFWSCNTSSIGYSKSGGMTLQNYLTTSHHQ